MTDRQSIFDTVAGLGAATLRVRERAIEQDQRAGGITFRVMGQ